MVPESPVCPTVAPVESMARMVTCEPIPEKSTEVMGRLECVNSLLICKTAEPLLVRFPFQRSRLGDTSQPLPVPRASIRRMEPTCTASIRGVRNGLSVPMLTCTRILGYESLSSPWRETGYDRFEKPSMVFPEVSKTEAVAQVSSGTIPSISMNPPPSVSV